MSRAMTFAELERLYLHIESEHSPIMGKNKRVKYVDPHIDMRDGLVFSVTFRGFGWEQNLNCANENRENPDSLFKRCMDFLDAE